MHTDEKNGRGITKKDFKAGLIKLGLAEGDTISVHSSLSSFGRVKGGADAMIDEAAWTKRAFMYMKVVFLMSREVSIRMC